MIRQTISPDSCFGKSSILRKFILAGLFITFICLIFNHGALGGIPHGWDAAAYYFQSQVFADFRVAASSTPFIDFFWLTNLVNGYESRYAKYPPGWPLLLTPAMMLGAPELANALMAGLCAILTALAAQRLYCRTVSWLTLGLIVLSPFYIFMGADYLSHMSCCTSLMFVLWALLSGMDSPLSRKEAWKWGLIAGAGAGIGFLIRPYSAFLGLTGCVWIVAIMKREHLNRGFRLVPGFLIPCMTAFALYLAYNASTTGSPFVTAYQKYNPDFNFLGEAGFHRASILANAGANIPKIARGLAGHVWGGFLPDIWLLVIVVILGFRERATRALLGAILIFCLGHSLYYYFDFYYGPRLVFEALPWFLIASAGGINLAFKFAGSKKPLFKTSLYTALLALLFLNFIKTPVITYPHLVRYYSSNYCGQGTDLLREVKSRELTNAVVFIRTTDAFAFANLNHLNSVALADTPVLFARYVSDPPERLPAMIRAFPRKEYWILDVSYIPIEGVNEYADRFEIVRLKWSELRIGSARSKPGPGK
jgi:4-amino-4-deoxy-L-arabinose transferase-like glycosyltransferase